MGLGSGCLPADIGRPHRRAPESEHDTGRAEGSVGELGQDAAGVGSGDGRLLADVEGTQRCGVELMRDIGWTEGGVSKRLGGQGAALMGSGDRRVPANLRLIFYTMPTEVVHFQ